MIVNRDGFINTSATFWGGNGEEKRRSIEISGGPEGVSAGFSVEVLIIV